MIIKQRKNVLRMKGKVYAIGDAKYKIITIPYFTSGNIHNAFLRVFIYLQRRFIYTV